jgi:hypothetical protein
MPEHDVQTAIIRAFQRLGIYVLRINAGSRSHKMRGAPAGTSDLLVVLRGGRAAWIEVKKPGEKPTAAQSEFLSARAKDGCITGVARSVVDALRIVGLEPPRRRV